MHASLSPVRGLLYGLEVSMPAGQMRHVLFVPSHTHRPHALQPGTLQQHRHPHVDVRVAQVWRIVPEAHLGWTALQLLHHMADTIVNGLEWVLGMCFEAEAPGPTGRRRRQSTPGLASLRALVIASMDSIWSQRTP